MAIIKNQKSIKRENYKINMLQVQKNEICLNSKNLILFLTIKMIHPRVLRKINGEKRKIFQSNLQEQVNINCYIIGSYYEQALQEKYSSCSGGPNHLNKKKNSITTSIDLSCNLDQYYLVHSLNVRRKTSYQVTRKTINWKQEIQTFPTGLWENNQKLKEGKWKLYWSNFYS